MKKPLLLFLFITAAFIVQAQDAKPTKEQTQEYILNVLKDFTETIGTKPSENVEFIMKNEIKEISFKDCFLAVKIRHYEDRYYKGKKDGFNEDIEEFQINLKDIESVYLQNYPETKSYLVFACFNASSLIPFKTKSDNETHTGKEDSGKWAFGSIKAPNDEKLVQAFNHLRKLCGAPDPIKF